MSSFVPNSFRGLALCWTPFVGYRICSKVSDEKVCAPEPTRLVGLFIKMWSTTTGGEMEKSAGEKTKTNTVPVSLCGREFIKLAFLVPKHASWNKEFWLQLTEHLNYKQILSDKFLSDYVKLAIVFHHHNIYLVINYNSDYLKRRIKLCYFYFTN